MTLAGAQPASLPPHGLDGLDSAQSRLVTVPERRWSPADSGHDSSDASSAASPSAPLRAVTWHLLDNLAQLEALGVQPVGTVLCVHGNPTWSYLWRGFVRAATDAAAAGRPAWRVIAVDQLEMGFSERTGRTRILPDRVADLGALTDELGLEGPVVTFGHDWGGVVSLGWAVDHPELLAGVMLLNTAVHQPEGDPIPAPLRLALRRHVLRPATVTTPAFLETTLALGHPGLSDEVKAGYRAPYRDAARREGIGGFVADIPVDAGHGSFAELERIAGGVAALPVPALMLWGPRDPIFSDRYLDDLVDRLPHADVHRFEGAGHLVAEDADYAAAALTWLGDRLPAGAVPEVLTSGAPATPATPATPARPLWHHLDDLADSDDIALVEMAPPGETEPRTVSWRTLSRRVRQLSAGLSRAGVRPGDRVSLLVPPGADLTAVLYACVRIGAVVVVADAGLGIAGLTRAVRGAWPQHVIGALPGLTAARALGWPGQKISTRRLSAPLAAALGVSISLPELAELGGRRGAARDGAARATGLRRSPVPGAAPAVASTPAPRTEIPEARPADVAAVLFTSGSTGPAKGVVYTHAQLGAVVAALSAQYGVGVGTGLVAGFAPFALLGPALGATSVTPDMNVTAPRTLTARAVAAAAKAVDATVVFLSPAALANVVATAGELDAVDRHALDGVDTFLSAGAPVSEQLLAAAAALMPNAVPHTPYGMTEGLLMADITLDGIREAAAGTAAMGEATAAAGDAAAGGSRSPGGVCVGRATATTRIRIAALDADGAASGEPSDRPGVTGEIVVSAPHVEDHYDRLWLTDRASRLGTTPGERWHRTGDVGHLDESGRLWVEGRLPHVVATAAGIVTPVGSEQAIERIAAVSRAALVGVGPRGTQQLVAVVELTDAPRRVRFAEPALAAAVRSAVRGVTGQGLAAVIVVPRLPTDIRHNSKIDRAALARWAEGVLAGGRLVAP